MQLPRIVQTGGGSRRRAPTKALPGLIVLLALAAAACAHRQPLVVVQAREGGAAVDIKASDYKFTPNNLEAHVGDRLEFRIENVSATNHNFTIKNPAGETLRSIALPAHLTVTVTVDLPVEGTYPFHCDVGLHAELGMKGWLKVTK